MDMTWIVVGKPRAARSAVENTAAFPIWSTTCSSLTTQAPDEMNGWNVRSPSKVPSCGVPAASRVAVTEANCPDWDWAKTRLYDTPDKLSRAATENVTVCGPVVTSTVLVLKSNDTSSGGLASATGSTSSAEGSPWNDRSAGSRVRERPKASAAVTDADQVPCSENCGNAAAPT
jgi:hypothetical protein